MIDSQLTELYSKIHYNIIYILICKSDNNASIYYIERAKKNHIIYIAYIDNEYIQANTLYKVPIPTY